MKYLNFYKILDKYFESRKKKKMDIIIENFSKNNIVQTKMLDDENFVLSVVKNVVQENVRDFSDIKALSHMSERLKDNKDFMLEIININGLYLQFASNRLRNDKDVVLEAVIKNSITLMDASNELQNNIDLLKELENFSLNGFILNENEKKWYAERLEILANLREKELIEKSITTSNIESKKMKF